MQGRRFWGLGFPPGLIKGDGVKADIYLEGTEAVVGFLLVCFCIGP